MAPRDQMHRRCRETLPLRRRGNRHALRIQGPFPPLCQIFSCLFRRVRDRNRNCRACAGIGRIDHQCQSPSRSRPPGSQSKLHSFRDGQRILMQILILLKQEKPLVLFSLFALFLPDVNVFGRLNPGHSGVFPDGSSPPLAESPSLNGYDDSCLSENSLP